jgi:hypothetical protein
MILAGLAAGKKERLSRITVPRLFGFQTDVISQGNDPFEARLEALAATDHFVRLKMTGMSGLSPFPPDDPLFSLSFNTLAGLNEAINEFTGRSMGEIPVEDSDRNPFSELLFLYYQHLPAASKTAVQALSDTHGSGLVLPLLLVSGFINATEYAWSLVAMRLHATGDFDPILAESTLVVEYLGCINKGDSRQMPVSYLVKSGEHESQEFKSTLRWDIRAGKTNQAIERASLKSISAFLNSEGGTLLIGIRDDGSVEGIETDKFPNEDKFLLHLWTLIRTCLGRDFSPYITTTLEKAEGKTVCIVRCQPAARPVFLRQPGFDEEMFIRVGPSSNALDISEALKYIAHRFPGVS